ncbi:formylmethanofuran dehydrogenase subunit C [Sporomusa sphaeroides]|uniref:formylmethanofuran dehydrogenase subunit C n=1 Tax=Sporomusa sphaeroides TaxID=47679 RepID=UPI00203027E8|nr:formylmethanofuran dehydrogenase subunit C [Sporomusa sphaeroides]MCM0759198.1 formylmethanofuran dehydrogenase subunit C [Sporomusa sphaeroides DSM 2875]HML35280.1 formylmethanofuran dehydrogenase subunit C [Sporomusa sphaeroides]
MKSKVILSLKKIPDLPVEAGNINPETVTGKKVEEIQAMPIWVGNQQESVGNYFRVEIADAGPEEDTENGMTSILVVKGELSRFKRLGEKMASGHMRLEGSVGFHTGAEMTGGVLTIYGDTGDFLGAHMKGGKIIVNGSAGHFTGAAYRGYTYGMTGGSILIKGSAGQMLGARLRRGLIAVGGDCGDMAGFSMKAGTIVIGGAAGVRAGAMMQRGTLLFFQRPQLLPTFYYNSAYQPLFWKLLHGSLQQDGFPMPADSRDAVFQRYSGDATEGGRGEIFVCLSRS